MPDKVSVFQNMSAFDAGAVMVAVVYLIEKMVGWIQKLRGTGSDDKSSEKIDKLYDMHNVRDRDQVPVWYIKQSMLDDINKMSNDLEAMRHTLEDIVNSDDEQLGLMRKIDLFHAKGGCSSKLNRSSRNNDVIEA